MNDRKEIKIKKIGGGDKECKERERNRKERDGEKGRKGMEGKIRERRG